MNSSCRPNVWQDYDLAPEFPEMKKFLDFWQQTLDGPLHSIRYSHKRLIGPNEWRNIDGEFTLADVNWLAACLSAPVLQQSRARRPALSS